MHSSFRNVIGQNNEARYEMGMELGTRGLCIVGRVWTVGSEWKGCGQAFNKEGIVVTEEETEIESTKAKRMGCEPGTSGLALQTLLPVTGTSVPYVLYDESVCSVTTVLLAKAWPYPWTIVANKRLLCLHHLLLRGRVGKHAGRQKADFQRMSRCAQGVGVG